MTPSDDTTPKGEEDGENGLEVDEQETTGDDGSVNTEDEITGEQDAGTVDETTEVVTEGEDETSE